MTDCVYRDRQMIKRYLSGETLQVIGDFFGLSRERVRQILRANDIATSEGGQALKTRKIKAKKCEEYQDKNKKHVLLTGYSIDEYQRIMKIKNKAGNSPQKCFRTQRGNATRRGISWDLNFYDWWVIWLFSGRYHKRGIGIGWYGMHRLSHDIGFNKDNVTVIRNENLKYN